MSIFQKLQAQQLGLEDVSDVEEMTDLELDSEISINESKISESNSDIEVDDFIYESACAGTEQLIKLTEAVRGLDLTDKEAALAKIGFESIVNSNYLGKFLNNPEDVTIGEESIITATQDISDSIFGGIKSALSGVSKGLEDIFSGISLQKVRLNKVKKQLEYIKKEGRSVKGDLVIKVPGALTYKGSSDPKDIIAGFSATNNLCVNTIDQATDLINKSPKFIMDLLKVTDRASRNKMLMTLTESLTVKGVILGGKTIEKSIQDGYDGSKQNNGALSIVGDSKGISGGEIKPLTVAEITQLVKEIDNSLSILEKKRKIIKEFNMVISQLNGIRFGSFKMDNSGARYDAAFAISIIRLISKESVYNVVKEMHNVSKSLVSLCSSSVVLYK